MSEKKTEVLEKILKDKSNVVTVIPKRGTYTTKILRTNKVEA